MQTVRLVLIFILLGCTSKLDAKPMTPPLELRTSSEMEVKSYSSWVNRNSKMIPSKEDRKIVLAYLRYLDTQTKTDGNTVENLLKTSTLKNKHRLSGEWLSFFEGNHHLIHKTSSLGSLTTKRFLPLLEEGNSTALELFLVYSACVASEGGENELLADYIKVIQKKHSAKLEMIYKKNADFFKNYPAMLF